MPNFTSQIVETFTGDTGTINTTNTLTITSIGDVSKRVVGCKTGVQTNIATFAAAESTSANAYNVDEVKYVRVTNLDASKTISLGIIGAATCHNIKLGPDASWTCGITGDAYLAEASTNPGHASHADINAIEVGAVASGVVQVEIVIAST